MRSREEIKKYQKDYYLKNREDILFHKHQNKEQHRITQNIWRTNNIEKVNTLWREQKAEILKIIGDKCIICGSTERLQFHEIHGLNHRRTLKYYREHSQDFITLCYHHHITVHAISDYPEILKYRIVKT